MTLKGVMAVTLRYFTEFGKPVFQHNRVDLWRNLCTSLCYFVTCVYDVVVKKVHLLTSFLFLMVSHIGSTFNNNYQSMRHNLESHQIHSMISQNNFPAASSLKKNLIRNVCSPTGILLKWRRRSEVAQP